MQIDERCGKRLGIFDILYLCDYKSQDGHKLYRVKCTKCGWETDMKYSNISDAKTCRHNLKHWNNKRIGGIYNNILSRCYNTKDKSYRFYGAKGIKVCDEWLKNAISFEEWSFKNGYKDNLTIDRINSKRDYSPENCRWITLEDNSRFKSNTNVIIVNGIKKSGKQWSKFLGLGVNYINRHIREFGIEETKKFIENCLKQN